MSPGVVIGDDGLARCGWGADPQIYRDYHDTEWGRPVRDERALYEKISLEAFQSGLSWLTILRKRDGFREAFAGFDPEVVAAFDDDDVERLMADAAIVRNRAKITSTIANARAVLALRDEGTNLAELVWSHAPPPAPRPESMAAVQATTAASTALAKDLKRRGFRFVGPTTAYAAMQSLGLVDDHIEGCHVAPELCGPGA